MEAEAYYMLVNEKEIQPINDFYIYCSKIKGSNLLFPSMNLKKELEENEERRS